MADKPTRLYWKMEDGPGGAEGRDPDDVGPAWVDYPDGRSEKVNEGEWITRHDAALLAESHGYDLQVDDGQDDVPRVQAREELKEADAINARLRSLGVSKAELNVKAVRKAFWLSGSLAARIHPDDPASVFDPSVFAGLVMQADDALAAIDRLVPGWRKVGEAPSIQE